ncbi:hypothetical protein ACFLZH_03430 [Patescibacteria group bacterium]
MSEIERPNTKLKLPPELKQEYSRHMLKFVTREMRDMGQSERRLRFTKLAEEAADFVVKKLCPLCPNKEKLDQLYVILMEEIPHYFELGHVIDDEVKELAKDLFLKALFTAAVLYTDEPDDTKPAEQAADETEEAVSAVVPAEGKES